MFSCSATTYALVAAAALILYFPRSILYSSRPAGIPFILPSHISGRFLSGTPEASKAGPSFPKRGSQPE